jgi:hypothetical protein
MVAPQYQELLRQRKFQSKIVICEIFDDIFGFNDDDSCIELFLLMDKDFFHANAEFIQVIAVF